MTEISSSKTFDELFTMAEKNPPTEMSSSPQHPLPPSGIVEGIVSQDLKGYQPENIIFFTFHPF